MASNLKPHPSETPVHRVGKILVKRDDLFEYAGAYGGKARTCAAIVGRANPPGLVTASSRASPQAQIVARIGHAAGVPVRLHMPTGKYTPEMDDARDHRAELIQHKAGYNSVIVARAKEDAYELKWLYIPFGMEHKMAVEQTAGQVPSCLPYKKEIKRIVLPIGSGMSAAGLLWGLNRCKWQVPVLGVMVGAKPNKRLHTYAPPMWRSVMTLVPSGFDYHSEVSCVLGAAAAIPLDPVYEAKCAGFLKPGDLFWIVGRRTR